MILEKARSVLIAWWDKIRTVLSGICIRALSISDIMILLYYWKWLFAGGIIIWFTDQSIDHFVLRKNIPSIISCDTSDAILRSVGDLIFALTDDWNCIFVRSSSLICIDLFENALCNREEENMGHDRRIMGFPLISFWDMKSEIESQSINPCVDDLIIKLDRKNDGRNHLTLFRILHIDTLLCLINEIDFLFNFLD